MIERVAIVEVGLIGGSFGRALRHHGFAGRIFGVSSPTTIKAALDAGAIDEGLPIEQAVPQADLVLLAQPISRILEIVGGIDRLLAPGALVTDVGSTKREICARARISIRHGVFVGGHPMAGKESRGVEHSDPALFQDRTWFLTPPASGGLDRGRAGEFVEWLRTIGAVPSAVSAEEHDRLVSLSSHLPQLLATTLASLLKETLPLSDTRLAAGPGLLGMTRLAMSSYDIWADILATNPDRIAAALDAFIERLGTVRDQVRAGERDPQILSGTLGSLFDSSADFVKALRKTHT
jgi:prephenate dehydrogenase